MTSFWCLIFFFIGEFFIFSLGSVIYKKYTNTSAKHNNYTNAIDISIIRSCGGDGVVSAGGRGGGGVGSVGSFISFTGSISAAFFVSFRILSLYLFILYPFVLPQHVLGVFCNFF